MNYKRAFAPVAERSEPQVPIEARLVRRVNAWSFGGILRLVAERIRDPVLAVIRSLKLNLKAFPGHAAKQAVLVCDSKRLEKGHWFRRQRNAAKSPGQEEKGIR